MSQSVRSPDDLVCPGLRPDDCEIFDDYEGCEFTIQSDRKRATAIDLYAREMGHRFQEVRCERRYLRVLTYQESYSHNAEDDARNDFEDEWADNHEPPLKYWTKGEFSEYGWRTPDGTKVEPPPWDGTVPADWEPGDYDPAWEFCKKTDPGAMPCWFLTERKS